MKNQHKNIDNHSIRFQSIMKHIWNFINPCGGTEPFSNRGSEMNIAPGRILFSAKSLFRSEREEQDTFVRRPAFTKKEEQRLLEALRFPSHKLMKKEEIRTVYRNVCRTAFEGLRSAAMAECQSSLSMS